ncbi:MAG: sulfatase-like hydrolase/transferase, partial [Planctomycetota bacterium]|nr:sulfatase-like hydrolase/transferase [Planctomycetota bacterium]
MKTMTRSPSLYFLLARGFTSSNFAVSGAPKRPNILLIMSDDHTTQAFGVYGSRLAKLNPTPVIDRLAKEGMLFENCFCNNSICTPSRASIITGQYSQ